MAVALDTTTSASAPGVQASLTWSHTCTGTNLILIVFAGHGAFNNANDDYTATYNGVAMTSFQTLTNTNARLTGFYLINPATGANNVIITSTGNQQRMVGIAHSYTGAKQSGQPDSVGTGNGSGTDYTASTTVVLNGSCWEVIGANRSAASYTGGTSTTLRQSVTDNNGFNMGSGDSNGTVPSGSQALHLTGTSGGQQTTIVLSIANAPIAYTLTCTQQSYTYTTQSASFSIGHTLTATQASFTLTGFSVTLTPFFLWVNSNKDVSTFNNRSKNSSSWVDNTKSTSVFNNVTKH